ncbi:MAG TPA: hypothetical protein VF547_03055, partial [Allosphingosinicella sp.]
VAAALALAFTAKRHGRPFFLAAALVAASMVLFETVGRWPAWHSLFARFAGVPLAPVIAVAAAAGCAIAWAGWTAGSVKARGPAAQPA